jgi:hypothetical protein
LLIHIGHFSLPQTLSPRFSKPSSLIYVWFG